MAYKMVLTAYTLAAASTLPHKDDVWLSVPWAGLMCFRGQVMLQQAGGPQRQADPPQDQQQAHQQVKAICFTAAP
jgi:hypothetical protein